MADQDIQSKDGQQDYGQTLAGWSFSEFDKHVRSTDWYVWTGIGVALLLLFAFMSQNFLFGLIIILSLLIMVMFQRSNQDVQFQITEDGILVNKKFYPYAAVKNFYIIYQPPTVKKVFFELNGYFSPRIPVDLQDQDPVKIREVLLEYIDEDIDREKEPTSEEFSRMFKL